MLLNLTYSYISYILILLFSRSIRVFFIYFSRVYDFSDMDAFPGFPHICYGLTKNNNNYLWSIKEQYSLTIVTGYESASQNAADVHRNIKWSDVDLSLVYFIILDLCDATAAAAFSNSNNCCSVDLRFAALFYIAVSL